MLSQGRSIDSKSFIFFIFLFQLSSSITTTSSSGEILWIVAISLNPAIFICSDIMKDEETIHDDICRSIEPVVAIHTKLWQSHNVLRLNHFLYHSGYLESSLSGFSPFCQSRIVAIPFAIFDGSGNIRLLYVSWFSGLVGSFSSSIKVSQCFLSLGWIWSFERFFAVICIINSYGRVFFIKRGPPAEKFGGG